MADKKYGLLKMSSTLVKISAWTFFLFGIIQAIAIFTRADTSVSIGVGFVWLAIYASIFFFMHLMGLMADLLLEMWQFLKKERF